MLEIPLVGRCAEKSEILILFHFGGLDDTTDKHSLPPPAEASASSAHGSLTDQPSRDAARTQRQLERQADGHHPTRIRPSALRLVLWSMNFDGVG